MVAAAALLLVGGVRGLGGSEGESRALEDLTTAAQAGCRHDLFHLEPFAQAHRQAVAMMRRMTLAQEIELMHGVGRAAAPSGSIGATEAIPRLGIPAVNQEDGPGGVGDGATGVTQLPAGEALAATFDPVAARCYGSVIGREARAKGINEVYGPTVNIVRLPQWGRSFESLGEDPLLTGIIAAAEVDGIQGAGTMAQVKHYAVYNQETYRNTPRDDAVVSEKALHQIYLRAWGQIVAAGPSSVMCSYANINGVDACQSSALIEDYLDRTLHFQGFVASDYGATHSTVAAAKAGLDQEQPGAKFFGPSLLKAVKHHLVPRATVDRAVDRILTQMYRFRLFTDDARGTLSRDVASRADERVADEVAEESLTVLKNASGLLPLPTTGSSSIAVLGPAGSVEPLSVGGGSATVTAGRVVTPLAALRTALRGRRRVRYRAGIPNTADSRPVPAADLSPAYPAAGNPHRFEARLTAPETGIYELSYTEPDDYSPVSLSIDGRLLAVDPGTPPRHTYTGTVRLVANRTYTLLLSGRASHLRWLMPAQIEAEIASAAATADHSADAIVVVGDGQESEAADRATLELPDDQNQLVDAVAAANPHTVVVIDAGGPVAMPWLSRVEAVVDAWYPGETDGAALTAVLLGKVDPSGHLPMTFPRSLAATPVSSREQFPGTHGRVHYSEGVDLGYRGYETGHLRPLFWFGYGLSYTTFGYSHIRVHATWSRPAPARPTTPAVTVVVTVTNTGRRAGADIAQVYLGQPRAANDPPRQLEGFQRVTLRPRQSRRLTFVLGARRLAYWDTARADWRIPSGTYTVWVGDSSALAQLPLHARVRLTRATKTGP